NRNPGFLDLFGRSQLPIQDQTMVRTTPPSTLSAVPLVADASGLQTYTTRFATSSVVAKRFSKLVGRTFSKNSFSTSATDPPCASFSTKSLTPSEAVGPGRTALTVTPVFAVVSASPLEIANCAVLVNP